MLRATIFDLDDTLIDSGQAWERVCAAFAARHGHTWTDADSTTLHGNGGWVGFLSELCGGAVDTAVMVEECAQAMAVECAAGRIAALPGALELVEEAERHGPIGLASASPRAYVHAALDHFGLLSRMTTVVCGEDVTHGKPAPEPYERAAEELGLAPHDCLAVEDSPNGIRSAAAAGCRVLAIPRGGMRLPTEVGRLVAVHVGTALDAVPQLARLHGIAPQPLVHEGAS